MHLSISRKLSWDWRSIVLHGTNIAIELCWLYALMLLLNEVAGGGRMNLLGLTAIYLISFGFNKYLQRLEWRKTALTAINWLFWLIVMLVSVKVQLFSQTAWANPEWLLSIPLSVPRLIYVFEPQLLLLLLSLLLWWLGKWCACRRTGFSTSITEFQFGLILLVLVFTIAAALKLQIPRATAITVLFFISALSGVSLAHLMEGKSRLLQIGRLHMSWMVLGSIALALVLGLLIAVAISPDLLRLLLAALAWVGSLFMYILAWLASLIPSGGSGEALPPMASMPPVEPEQEQFWKIPENIRRWMQLGWGVIWIGFFALALWRISSQIYTWLKGRTRVSSMANQPMRGAFKEDILALLKRIWSRLAALRLFMRLPSTRGTLSAGEASVFQIYRQLLKWGAGRGYSRVISQTPQEYMAWLEQALPKAGEDLLCVTQCFMRTRYSMVMPTATELVQIKQSWERIKIQRISKRAD
ncbi:MAG TPA: DUF4129 domain-containing protein [Dehalococcoidia bacterium]|nr:DUF4129 domain-containing protein [Dehalococcoidia bacterium]